MTVYRDICLVKKPTDALSSNFIIGISTLHVSGNLSAHHQEFLSRTKPLVQFMQFGDHKLPGAGWYHPDDGQKDCSKHVESKYQ